MLNTKTINKSFRTSLWLAYVIIVFEILYMISPFAFLFYSVYAVPLKWLQSSPYTLWLTTNILPHFTFQRSIIISLSNLLSWPLIAFGTFLFLAGFIQIYWAKFRRKGSVSKGLYKYIRHPQYVALALIGLGAAIYWSRFIVWLMFATMLFLYYALARQEEKICLMKFGESYQIYLERTGMFFPKWLENHFPRIPTLLPEKGIKKILALGLIYCIYISAVTGFGFLMKNYALSKTMVLFNNNTAVVSLAPSPRGQIQKIWKLAYSDPEGKKKLNGLNLKKNLIYVLPSEWGIPELGIRRRGNKQNYLLHPETHGNSLVFDSRYFTVLVTEPILPSPKIKGKNILKRALSFTPYLEIYVDLQKEKVIGVKERTSRGQWDGIPVPIY